MHMAEDNRCRIYMHCSIANVVCNGASDQLPPKRTKAKTPPSSAVSVQTRADRERLKLDLATSAMPQHWYFRE